MLRRPQPHAKSLDDLDYNDFARLEDVDIIDPDPAEISRLVTAAAILCQSKITYNDQVIRITPEMVKQAQSYRAATKQPRGEIEWD